MFQKTNMSSSDQMDMKVQRYPDNEVFVRLYKTRSTGNKMPYICNFRNNDPQVVQL